MTLSFAFGGQLNATIQDNMTVEFDHDKKRASFVQWGPINKKVLLDSYELIYETEGYDPDYGYLVDYREVSKVDLTAQDIREVLKAVGEMDSRIGKSAIVTGDKFGRLMLTKLYCELSSFLSKGKTQRKAFRKIGEAEAWLDSVG